MMIKKLVPYYKPYWKLFVIDSIAALLIATIDLMTPRVSSILIDRILPQGKFILVLQLCAVLLIAYIMRVALEFVVEYWGHVLGIGIERDMRQEMFEHIQTLPVSFFDNIQTGKLMSRLVNDLNEISEAAHHGPEDFIIAVFLLFGSFFMMFKTNWILACAMAVLVPIMLVVAVQRNSKYRIAFREMRTKIAEINAQAEDNFSGIRVVKAFTAEEKEIQQFLDGNNDFARSKKRGYKVMAEFGITTKGFIHGIQLVVFVLGSYLILENRMSVGNLVEFLLYIQLFQIPITKISALLNTFNQAMAGIERFFAIRAIPSQMDEEEAVDLENIEGHVRYEHVSFAYEKFSDNRKVLNDISFGVLPSKTIAFVGPSGGGKSTLCSLLPRLYDFTEGSITIDGIDIRSMTMKSLRQHIGIVQQDVFIFAGTIRDNILIGRPGANDAAVIEAARQAEALAFIEDLPQGLDTDIGQRGVKLSGGQKQRISLARIFLKNPRILILDEATSALDNRTESLIQNTLSTLSRGRTTLIVAHRLSTIKDADWICVVGKEGIIEEGTHATLYAKHGVYTRLCQAQIDQQYFN